MSIGRLSSFIATLSLGVVGAEVLAQVQVTGLGMYRATAISADGRVVAGIQYLPCDGGSYAPVIWTETTGAVPIGALAERCEGQIYALSSDGSVAVGAIRISSSWYRAIRWTAQTGPVDLGLLPGCVTCTARAVSADGSVVVGQCSTGSGGARFGFVWTEATGILQVPVPGAISATAISADERWVCGTRQRPGGWAAYRWDRTTSAVYIDVLPSFYPEVVPKFVAKDGRLIVGETQASGPWIWRDGQVSYCANCGTVCWAYGANLDASFVAGRNIHTGGGFPVMWIGPTYAVTTLASFLEAFGHQSVPISSHFAGLTGITPDGLSIVGEAEHSLDPYKAFRIDLCYANCDYSTPPGVLNAADFSCFLAKYADAQHYPENEQYWHYANCDKSTTPPVINVADFSCFLQKFAAGCP
jgi:uncharacterized membrane protein